MRCKVVLGVLDNKKPRSGIDSVASREGMIKNLRNGKQEGWDYSFLFRESIGLATWGINQVFPIDKHIIAKFYEKNM
ncbi:hypothetical protein [Selenomonas ruminantium]|uniref:hypothetical protein n=1 Tax=Selenomonas ruminantium TaxID=971 RepID=UPI0005A4F80D|nr:hypothetical protein [Selenomonas ruminantium]